MKAINTHYHDYYFRSRLEAKYAVFFDALHEKWEYEKEGYDLDDGDYYLPDFWLPRVNMFVEIKGEPPNEREIRVARKLQFHTGHDVLICHGQPADNGGLLFYAADNIGTLAEHEVWWDWDWEEESWCLWVAGYNPEDEHIVRAALTAKQTRFEFGRPQQQVVDYDNIPF